MQRVTLVRYKTKPERADENEALFQKTFFQEIVPYAEKHYRVLPGPANRACC